MRNNHPIRIKSTQKYYSTTTDAIVNDKTVCVSAEFKEI